ncbi:DDE-type integrase/transposase/recombinase [Pseudomonas aeruginosa]|uniref:Mu transposase C-terminal domain-containing protein n=1 Tax=Pseudomonas aeruginosa TaxID=287 RepID=UPI001C9793A8|nr:DDE-type integrase/transposase/recombinase [Pseudomonas aeruginosa]
MTKSTLLIGPGAILKIDGQHLCVVRFENASAVQVSVVETGLTKSISLSEITAATGKQTALSGIDLTDVDPDAWRDALEKFHWIEPLLYKPDRTHADVQAIADELLVSLPTVYRWVRKLEQQHNIRCLLRQRRGDTGSKRLSKEVEELLERIIREKYLTILKRSPTATYKELKDECRRLQLPPPSKGTLLRRINEILPGERELRRRGPNAALKYKPNEGSIPGVNGLYSLWQIDHTQVDIELVDSVDRIAIGRPWITMVIDLFSRMVVGWYVSFDPPGSLGTGLAITNAVLPKDDFLCRLGLKYSWPCQGKPRVIHCDNAKEFQGSTLEAASLEHGFQLRFRKKRRPQYGAHIERFLGTLAEEIHAIEGTTFSNVGAKAEYDSAGNAVLTLDNFEIWLAHLILGEYHNRQHSGLPDKITPLTRFHQGLLGTDEFPGLGILPISGAPEQLRLDFLPIIKRTVQTYGVQWEYIEYYDAVLAKWIGRKALGNTRKARELIFRYDPRNIKFLYFLDPEVKKYFAIPYRVLARPEMSLWELRAVRRFMEARGVESIDEEAIFRSREARRHVLNVDTALTRQAAKERERARAHKKVGPMIPSSTRGAPLEMPEPVPGEVTDRHTQRDLDLQNLAIFDEFEEV